MRTGRPFRWVLCDGDLNDAHSFQSTKDDMCVFFRQYEYQNPPTATPLGVAQLYGPLIGHTSLGNTPAVDLWPISEPWQFLHNHGSPNARATNPQEVFVVECTKDQNGKTTLQAMTALRRAIAHGCNPSEDDLVQFLQHENSSYTCLCLDGVRCGKRFERRHRAVDHVRGHFGLRAYPCRGGCGKLKW